MYRYLLLLIITIVQLFALTITKGEVHIFEFDEKIPKSIGFDGAFTLPIIDHPSGKYIAILPINYKSDSKTATLTMLYDEGTKRIEVQVVDGDYKKETLQVAPSKVSPPKEQRSRIQKEYEEAMKIYRTNTPQRYWEQPFILPLQSTITSHYGNARIFNNSLQSFHSGVDFRAAIGTPVVATNDGVVVISQDRYFAGGSIVIDHGYGIYSIYYHLSQMDKKVGETVKRGEVIGLSGDSGRVTGPHLHFGITVLGYAINPLDFINKINATF